MYFTIIINPLQNAATKIFSASSGNRLITPSKMRTTLKIGTSPAHCSTAANPGAPVQNTPPSPTADTAPASLTPSNAARAQHAVRRTPANLTALGGGVSITTNLGQPVSSVPARLPPTTSCREPHAHALQWRPRRMNAVDNVKTYLTMLVSSVL